MIFKASDSARFCASFPELCKFAKESQGANKRSSNTPPPYKILPADEPCLHLIDPETGESVNPPINEPCTEQGIASSNGSGTAYNYWTKEKMRNAKPAPLGELERAEQSNKTDALGPGVLGKTIREGGRTVGASQGAIQRTGRNPQTGRENWRDGQDVRKDITVNPLMDNQRGIEKNDIRRGYISSQAHKDAKRVLVAFQSVVPEFPIEACEDCNFFQKQDLQNKELVEKIKKTAPIAEKIFTKGWKLKVASFAKGKNKELAAVKKETRKLLWFMPVEVKLEAKVSEKGEILEIKKPWWSFLAF